MDSALRAAFLRCLDADLALDPRALASCGPQPWELIAARWTGTTLIRPVMKRRRRTPYFVIFGRRARPMVPVR